MDALLGLLAVVTFLIALYAIGRINTVAQRLDELRGEIGELRRRFEAAGPGARRSASVPPPQPASPVPPVTVASEATSVGSVSAPPAGARATHGPAPPAAIAPISATAGVGPQQAATVDQAPIPPSPRSSASVMPPAPSASLEERLGARLPVWLGSIALALAGAFLVKYTFDRGLLSPAVRVILGLVFGVVLLGCGEWMRRSNMRIAQGLSAAGIADLYACFLAASNLYHLVSPATGFLFIALNTAGAVALALRQGAIVATVGMAGGFLTPMFVGSEEPRPQTLFAYFLFLQCGLLAVSRKRGWSLVPLVSFGAGLFWVMGWLAGPFRAPDAVSLEVFLLTSIALAVGGTWRGVSASGKASDPTLRVVACVGGFVAMAALLMNVAYVTEEWVFLAVLSVGVLVLARIDERLEAMLWVPPAAVAVLVLFWLGDLSWTDGPRFLWTLGGFAGLFGLGAYAVLFGARRPAHWAALSAIFGLFALLAGYAGWEQIERSFPWGVTSALGAIVYALLAWPLLRKRERLGDAPLAAMLVAASAFVSLAVPFELEREWLAAGWAVEVLALVALAGRLRVATLRPMALLLAAAVSVRLLLNPYVLEYPIGSLPVFNWLLYGYGVPLLAFAGAAVLAARSGDGALRDTLTWMAICFALGLATLQVRQGFHPGGLSEGRVDFREWGSYAIAWVVLSGILLRAARRWPGAVLRQAGSWGLTASAGAAVACPTLALLVAPQDLGPWPLFNHALWVFGLTALLIVLARRDAVFLGLGDVERWLEAVAVTLLWLLVTVGLRHFFHRVDLRRGDVAFHEWGAYVSAWLALGAGLWEIAARGSSPVRERAGAVILATALFFAVVGPGLLANPLFTPQGVGAMPIANHVSWVFGVPIAGALWIWRAADRRARKNLARAGAAEALLLSFLLVSFEVRQLFHGGFLDRGPTSGAERYTYSAAWILLGTLLLVLGISLRRKPMRFSALGVMLLAVIKVFLYDLAALRDLYRVFSFLGLGASLLLLAWLYQRYVFRESAPSDETP